MTLYHWSQTAANNNTADITCPFPEGQAPSSVNDSARGMMAAVAKYRDDVSGQITTAGTSTAYTVSSFQGFDSLADMHGKEVWFTPHTTNGATVTLNVDSLGAKPLRSAPGVELLGGVMVQGTPYGAIYNNTDGAFYLKGFFGTPFVPVGVGFDYWGSTAPNSSFAFPYGQQISQTTYATLYAAFGPNRYGPDGGGLFYMPDKRGRASFPPDNMGGSAAGRLTTAGGGIDGTTIGATGGSQAPTIALANLPNYAPGFAGQAGTVNVNSTGPYGSAPSLVGAVTGGGAQAFNGGSLSTVASSGTFTPAGTVGSINGNVTQTGFKAMPPAIVVPYLIRII